MDEGEEKLIYPLYQRSMWTSCRSVALRSSKSGLWDWSPLSRVLMTRELEICSYVWTRPLSLNPFGFCIVWMIKNWLNAASKVFQPYNGKARIENFYCDNINKMTIIIELICCFVFSEWRIELCLVFRSLNSCKILQYGN